MAEDARLLAKGESPLDRTLRILGFNASWRGAALPILKIAGTVALVFLGSAFWPWAGRLVLPLLALVLPSLGPGLLAMNPLEFAAVLRRTRREQALVALLPGMPRGGVLNRGLTMMGWRAFAATWTIGTATLAALALLVVSCSSARLGVIATHLACAIVIGSIPAAVLPCRRWASLSLLPAGFSGGGYLGLMALEGVAFGIASIGRPLWPLALGVVSSTALWCAWRWRRMAEEPSAWPVERLAQVSKEGTR